MEVVGEAVMAILPRRHCNRQQQRCGVLVKTDSRRQREVLHW